jgi:hypothetical protein
MWQANALRMIECNTKPQDSRLLGMGTGWPTQVGFTPVNIDEQNAHGIRVLLALKAKEKRALTGATQELPWLSVHDCSRRVAHAACTGRIGFLDDVELLCS